MPWCDFVVHYNPDTDTYIELTERILWSIYIRRIKAHKPVVTFISGDSGEGKSLSTIKLMQILLKIQGLNLKDFLDDVNIYTPIEYPDKVEKLLFDKRLKKVNVVCIHEAREVVKAKQWHSFLVQAVADINAMSRSIKRMCVFIVSQFIRDISTDIRYTLRYYIEVRRPMNAKARLYINVMWKDVSNLEKPMLKKRKLAGYLVMPNGKYKRFIPSFLELSLPDRDIKKAFEEADKNAKAKIIKKKLDRLMTEIRQEAGLTEEDTQVRNMLEFYTNPKMTERIFNIGKRFKGRWKMDKKTMEMYKLSSDQVKLFENGILKFLNNRKDEQEMEDLKKEEVRLFRKEKFIDVDIEQEDDVSESSESSEDKEDSEDD